MRSTKPAFEDRPRVLAAMRSVFSLLQDNDISEKSVLDRYNAVIGTSDKAMRLSVSRLNDFTNGNSVPRPRELILPKLWEFLAKSHPSYLARAWAETASVDIEFDDPLASRIHNFLANDQSDDSRDTFFDMETVEAFHGSYTAYRPFYLNPSDEMMVMDLTCGGDENPTGFSLTMSFPLHGDEIVTEVAKGSMIPCDGNLILFGHIERRRLPVVITLKINANDGGKVREAAGVILICSTQQLPSSYPIYCIRTVQPCVPQVIERSKIQEDTRLWRLIGPTMRRGFVDWQ